MTKPHENNNPNRNNYSRFLAQCQAKLRKALCPLAAGASRCIEQRKRQLGGLSRGGGEHPADDGSAL